MIIAHCLGHTRGDFFRVVARRLDASIAGSKSRVTSSLKAVDEMKQFKMFSDAELVDDTKRAVSLERLSTMAVLDRRREIFSRSLHLSLGFTSLHEICVAELHYSDGATHRRIGAMGLCKGLPNARQALCAGSLSLTNAASLQNFFKKDENRGLTVVDKEKVLGQVNGKSKAECDRIFNPEQTGTVVRFLPDDETIQMLKRLSELTAIGKHDRAAPVKRAVRIALLALDPMEKKSGARKSGTRKPPLKYAAEAASPEKLKPVSPEILKPASPEKLKPASLEKLCPEFEIPSRYVAVAVERGVWTRDGGQCTFTDSVFKRRCTSRFGLQLDHVIPLACGGPSTLENLRLLCPGHNRLVAQRVFGSKKIASIARQ